MRSVPPLTRAPAFPVIAGIAIMATVVTIATKAGNQSLDPFTMNSIAFDSEPWRLAISALPHGDGVHLLFNLFWFWVLGTQIEAILGHVTTLVLFVVLAVGSAAAQYLFDVGGIGLSGVGYGIVGFLVVMKRLDPRFRDGIDRRTAILFGVWFVFCILTTLADIWNIGNVAHGAGFVLGALAAPVIARGERTHVPRAGAALGLTIVLAGSLGGAALWRPRFNLSSRAAQSDAYLGWRALGEKRYVDAIRHLERALVLSPDATGSWMNYGIALDEVRGHRGINGVTALDAFRMAHRLEPSEPQFRAAFASHQTRLGIEAQQRGDHAAAIPLYLGSLATEETPAATWNLAAAYDQLGEREKAMRMFERAAELDPALAMKLDDLRRPDPERPELELTQDPDAVESD